MYLLTPLKYEWTVLQMFNCENCSQNDIWYQLQQPFDIKRVQFSSCRIRTYSYQLQMTHENCSKIDQSQELFDIKSTQYLFTVQSNLAILKTKNSSK